MAFLSTLVLHFPPCFLTWDLKNKISWSKIYLFHLFIFLFLFLRSGSWPTSRVSLTGRTNMERLLSDPLQSAASSSSSRVHLVERWKSCRCRAAEELQARDQSVSTGQFVRKIRKYFHTSEVLAQQQQSVFLWSAFSHTAGFVLPPPCPAVRIISSLLFCFSLVLFNL